MSLTEAFLAMLAAELPMNVCDTTGCTQQATHCATASDGRHAHYCSACVTLIENMEILSFADQVDRAERAAAFARSRSNRRGRARRS